MVGDGAFVEKNDKTFVLKVSDKAGAGELKLVVSRSHRSEAVDKVKQKLGIEDEARSGSVGLKVGLIADRRADLYVHFSDKSCSWDACGPEAILRAAGGRFTDLSGKAFEYNPMQLQNSRGILACNSTAFEQVLPDVQAVATEMGIL